MRSLISLFLGSAFFSSADTHKALLFKTSASLNTTYPFDLSPVCIISEHVKMRYENWIFALMKICKIAADISSILTACRPPTRMLRILRDLFINYSVLLQTALFNSMVWVKRTLLRHCVKGAVCVSGWHRSRDHTITWHTTCLSCFLRCRNKNRMPYIITIHSDIHFRPAPDYQPRRVSSR